MAQVKADELDIEQSVVFQDIYQNIQKAITDLAVAEGYDLVLIDDSHDEVGFNPQSQTPRFVQLRQQYASRRIMYANPAIDITNDVIARMNNAFNAPVSNAVKAHP